jgi:hypothetical protein
MRSLNLLRWAGAIVLALSITPGRADAQDTLSITGTFRASNLEPTVGADLAGIQFNSSDRWWKLTLNGVTYSNDYFFLEDEFGGQYFEYWTRVHAASFTLEFYGPDAAILNEVVSRQLTSGGLANGAFLELVNAQYFDPFEWEAWSLWNLQIEPSDPSAGVRFGTTGYAYWFDTDEFGYPLVQPQRLAEAYSSIDDFRPGNGGSLRSFPDVVDLGSDQQPILPPPQVFIWDASKSEGNKGTTTLLMTVTLSRASSHPVTVDYRTIDGTALVSNKDYVRSSGTLTFLPGETSKTIALFITGDRKREPNETFTVQLTNAVGANFGRSAATATILNDD